MTVKKLNSVNKQKDGKREIKEKEIKARRKGGWDKNKKKGGRERWEEKNRPITDKR